MNAFYQEAVTAWPDTNHVDWREDIEVVASHVYRVVPRASHGPAPLAEVSIANFLIASSRSSTRSVFLRRIRPQGLVGLNASEAFTIGLRLILNALDLYRKSGKSIVERSKSR